MDSKVRAIMRFFRVGFLLLSIFFGFIGFVMLFSTLLAKGDASFPFLFCCLPTLFLVVLGLSLYYYYLKDYRERKKIAKAWLGKCPVCKKGKTYEIVKEGMFSISEEQVAICRGCAALFTQKEGLYRLSKVQDTTNETWKSYGRQTLTEREWKVIAKGGISDEKQKAIDILIEVEKKFDKKKFIDAIEHLNRRGYNLVVNEYSNTISVKKMHGLMTVKAWYWFEKDTLTVEGRANWPLILVIGALTGGLVWILLAFYYSSKKGERIREIRNLVSDILDESIKKPKKKKKK